MSAVVPAMGLSCYSPHTQPSSRLLQCHPALAVLSSDETPWQSILSYLTEARPNTDRCGNITQPQGKPTGRPSSHSDHIPGSGQAHTTAPSASAGRGHGRNG